MSEDIYQQAKTVFNKLIDLGEAEQREELAKLRKNSPDLAKEVSSLLEYHTAQSLVVPPASPKIRTRSTLSTTYQTDDWKWVRVPIRSLLISLPLLLIASGLSYWITRLAHQAQETSVQAYLNETIEHRRIELERWEQDKVSEAIQWSRNPEIQSAVRSLIDVTLEHDPHSPALAEALRESPHAQALGKKLQLLVGNEKVKYAVWDLRMLTICDWNQAEKPEVIGEFVTANGASMLNNVLRGNARMFLPRLGKAVTAGYKRESSRPIVSVFVPIFDRESVVAAMMLRGYGLEDEFQELANSWLGRAEEEVYLINTRGAILTGTRHKTQIEEQGIQLAIDETTSSKIPMARDPGVNLLRGETATSEPNLWPPTLMARQLASRNSGINVAGYRNYAGERVVGAWRWLPRHEIGIAIERNADAAFGVSNMVRNGLIAATLFFTLSLIGVTIAAMISSTAKRKLRDISEVGPYQVQELLGEGGMGRVYLAEHALLCRQSAVKVLTGGSNDLSVIGRFEREVQLASQLTHPNTISIYDFGRNEDGLFYYAMEYINGAHLGQLVEFAGPIEPGRCIFILKQLCRALLEAHQAGVVHRDIKPQNIMVCNRGGEPDFVKLFDYGLVKSFAPGVSHNSSQTKIVVGTPRFMAPERLNSPWLADPRVDVYSVGALAYFLLTGQLPPLVTMEDGLANQQTGVETLDLPHGVVDFGELLSVCMAVEPSTRPSNMASLLRELDELSKKFPWDRENSTDWWEKHESKLLLFVQNKRKKLDQSELRI